MRQQLAVGSMARGTAFLRPLRALVPFPAPDFQAKMVVLHES
jgi:hypothetical protein